MLLGGWDTPLAMLRQELVQLEEEGFEIPEELKSRIAALNAAEPWSAAVEPFYAELKNLARKSGFDYVEPNEWADIRAAAPAAPQVELNCSSEELLDKLHGAYTGRFAGCALGQVVEGWSMDAIRKYLEKCGDYPLRDYISNRHREESCWILAHHPAWKENVQFMGPDDDVNYTLMGLHVLEKYGRDFKWFDVATEWNSCLPYATICTAETQAILNYNTLNARCGVTARVAATPQYTRRYNNPYREWIGAQIRADGWAYCAAGNPLLAAEFAYRDACWTHEKNGIYGELFFAAMIAASFVESDLDQLVEIALGVIPANCRLSEAVRLTQKWCRELPDFESFVRRLDEHFPTMSAVHTINNAMICLMSLYYGKLDPDLSIAISVMAGKDTDCNGATVGSIVGAIRGYKRFGGILAPQLNDRVKPQMFGFQDTTMSELAERTQKVIEKVK